MNNKIHQRVMAFCLSAVVALGLLGNINHASAETLLSNPTIDSSGKATWDCVYFGSYWQNDTNGDGVANESDAKLPIKWRVLSVNGNDAFLLADSIIDWQVYVSAAGYETTWQTSNLRNWLNSYFLTTAFSATEQAAILDTTLKHEVDPKYYDPEYDAPEYSVQDKVFILTPIELSQNEYGFNPEPMYAGGGYPNQTAYVVDKGARTEYVTWWFRDMGYLNANNLIFDDEFSMGGDHLADGPAGVRPAMHIDLSQKSWTGAGRLSCLNGQTETLPGVEVDHVCYMVDAEYEKDGYKYTVQKCNGCGNEVIINSVYIGTPSNPNNNSNTNNSTSNNKPTRVDDTIYYITRNSIKYAYQKSIRQAWVVGVSNKKKTSYTVKDTIAGYPVVYIYENSFDGCKKAKKITIGKNMVSIYSKAFKNCKALRTVVVKSNNFWSIHKKAFKGCKDVKLKVHKKNYKSIKKCLKGTKVTITK